MNLGAAFEGTRRRGFDQLYAENLGAATRFAYLLTGDRHEADEIVQDAFVRLLGRFADLRNPDAFPAYLRRTIISVAQNRWRRRRLERAFVRREATTRIDTEARPLDHDHDHDLWMHLRALPARQRAAIVLRFYEDLSERQTAEILGCSVGAAKKLVARGLSTLRSTVGEDR